MLTLILLQEKNIDLKKKNSYELSFSFKDLPSQESDWIQLVPYGKTSIDSEVVFFDRSTKTALLRFYPRSVSIKFI